MVPENHLQEQAQSLTDKFRISLDQHFLQQIIDNAYDSIFVTDNLGTVLLANKGTGKFMGLTTEQLVGRNVLDNVKESVYDWSPTMQAIKTRSIVSGVVKNHQGAQQIATSKPIMDEAGDLVMVITNARDIDVVVQYIEALEKERSTANLYKTAARYLSEADNENKEIVAESRQMREIMRTSNFIARTDSTVMLIGETGTGKEVMARHIHRISLRAKEPFIPVNCAAIPQELLESEFFGYVRGAFSGASPHGKPGLFEIANKGTLFLDEIAELPIAMQSKLLRVLESGEAKRLGDTMAYQADVRFIAATNRDLKGMISQKLFRSDLYYRLNVIPISLPALRERPEDILALAYKFLDGLNKKYSCQKTLSAKARQALNTYAWPGNVRELRNVIERLFIISSDNIINLDDDYFINTSSLRPDAPAEKVPGESKPVFRGTLRSVVKALEEEYIDQVLADCGGRVGEAAQKLGIHRSVLYRKKTNR